MIPRTSILALWLLAATAAIAQDPVPTATTSINPATPTSTTSVVPVAEASPSHSPGSGSSSSGPASESAEYYPSTPGQSYDEDTDDSSDGATGESDTFIDIPLGAQVGIISAVVVVGVAGVVGCILWYLRRRRQWELTGRRSTIPKLAVNSRGEFTVGTQGDVPARAPRLRAPSPADSIDDLALEKGNVKSEFDSESTKSSPLWRRLSPFSKK